ncbi:MAG: ribosome maturation factor RimP [Pseudomonadales bacterium]
MATAAQLEVLFEPAVRAHGCELWGIDLMLNANPRMVRVYIEKEDGVNVDDCASVSRQISANLDVEEVIPGEYRLEVSSPGMDRPLFKLEQFHEYIGYELQVKLRMAFDGRRKFKGILRSIENDELMVHIDDEEFVLPYELVDSARVVPNFE